MNLHLRSRAWLAFAAALLAPALVSAQGAAPIGTTTQTPPASTATDEGMSGFIDVGLRGTAFASGSDEARAQRYRDLRTGPIADLFHYSKEDDSRSLKILADHVGYRDQHYWASYNKFGKFKATVEWNQVPLFFSETTQTLFTSPSAGVLRIDDAIQSGIQSGTTTLAKSVSSAQPFDMRLQRDIFDLKLTYNATPNLDWNVSFRNTAKDGHQPWAGTFGFSNAVELAVPVDTNATEFGSSVEWAGARGTASIGYDGSFFRNNSTTLVWDSPLRISDSPTAGPSQGRMSIWPNSNQNTISTTETLNLPYRTRAMAYFSVSDWSQNDLLIPFTINSALQSPALDRSTADASARVTSQNYALTSRPTPSLWFNARFRSYDFDNNTPIFNVPTTVSYDTSVVPYAHGGTAPYSVTRRTFDFDASLTPARYDFVALRAGYTRESVDQTIRHYDTTTDNVLRLSADMTSLSWLTVRGVYEHAKRVGSGLDEQSLDDIGEQVSLRQFDISDRIYDRFSLLAQVTPFSSLGVNGTVSTGKEDRPQTEFGLRSNDNHSYSIGVDYVPRDAVSLGFSYQYEKFNALQASRQANPGVQFDDPTRDWTTDSADRAHTLFASIDLLKLLTKTDIRIAYNYSDAKSTYVYGVPPNSTLAKPVQLSPVENTLQRGTLDVRYHLNPRTAIGGYYWYDTYSVNDFAYSPQTLSTLAPPSFLILGYTYKPYTAHTFAGRLTYNW